MTVTSYPPATLLPEKILAQAGGKRRPPTHASTDSSTYTSQEEIPDLTRTRFDIASETQTKKLERGWAKYRKQQGLDLYGKNGSAKPAELGYHHH